MRRSPTSTVISLLAQYSSCSASAFGQVVPTTLQSLLHHDQVFRAPLMPPGFAGYDFHMAMSDWKPRLRIEQTGSPILHRAAEPVAPEAIASSEIRQLIEIMIATLDGIGVGLAAPQVGAGLRIAVIGDPPELQASAT